MIKYYSNLEQGTPEWLQLRCGTITASIIKNILTKKFQVSKDAKVKLLALELASQRIIQKVIEIPKTFHLERGHVEEDLAKEVYSYNYNKVDECGFITSDILGFNIGFSPDGLIEEDGFIEVKSRLPKFQVQTICEDEVPDEYMLQIQTGFLVSERKWCDFIQFSNGMPLFVKRVEPDHRIIDTIRNGVIEFEEMIQSSVELFIQNASKFIDTEFIEHDFAVKHAGESKATSVFA